MSIGCNNGTGDIPLIYAKKLTKIVNESWSNGEFQNKTSPITQELLKFWFTDSFCDTRIYNFHQGQKQAVLNVIYLHEVLQAENVFDNYANIDNELLDKIGLEYLNKDKYSHPKYCLKMATGTGKTWVMNALLIWQFLNAKYHQTDKKRFSKNFLLVAPGLIVYERLLDAYLGKENKEGIRDFDTSDYKKYESLFIPPAYKETIFGFIQNNVVKKEEIGKKITGEGMIAITNWHLLAGVEEEDDNGLTTSPLQDPSKIINELLPIRPGKSQGHDISVLDNQYLRGGEIDYLAGLSELVVFNDEAHHIHETKKAGIVSEVEWQKSLNKISEEKGNSFIQIDFSATPYDVAGTGQKRTKHYFPHIVVDFDLKMAIHQGLVKVITIDKRKEIATTELDFRAVREGNNVIGLSDGQKLMLRAGLQKLRILEDQFISISSNKAGISNKHPKMLVICEDTKVSPFVVEFLTISEGLNEEDVVQIDSDKKGSIPQKEWDIVKQKLFNIDSYACPKVIVSVLMLREGFDVNNICVIVPLRSAQAAILLEQTIGRGLRLMWREPEYSGLKEENRKRVLNKKEAPDNYLDILSIVEHPAFLEFYEDINIDDLAEDSNDFDRIKEIAKGDIIKVGLKENYKDYDLYYPIILSEKEEYLSLSELSYETLSPFKFYKLETLKKLAPKDGETFFSEEITVKTTFGEYKVTPNLFTAKSYNEFLSKLVGIISNSIGKVKQRTQKEFPVMQINQASLVGLLDGFIKNKMFEKPFNPLENNNWRVLMLSEQGITNHIIKEVSKIIYEMQSSIDIEEAVIIKKYFSEVEELKMREKFSLDVTKTIYERLPYPSNKGEFEKQFILACDRDSEIEAFIKISEHYHTFTKINYIRTDGLLASYYPDFMIKFDDSIYLVETKAWKDMDSGNVVQKELSALNWIKKINEIKPNDRNDRTWHYVLLGDNTFYAMYNKGIWIKEILNYSSLTRQKVDGTLI